MTPLQSDAQRPWEPGPQDLECQAAYTRRGDEAAQRVAQCSVQERRFAPLRLAVFLLLVCLIFMAMPRMARVPLWGLAPVGAAALFFWVLARHGKLREALERARFDQAQYAQGLARLKDEPLVELDFEMSAGDQELAQDLDLVGANSLFTRLCRAQTGAGRKVLGAWLTQEVGQEEIRRRAAAVVELEGQLDWRHEFAAACRASSPISAESLLAEFQRPCQGSERLVSRLRAVGALSLLCGLAMIWALFSSNSSEGRLLVAGGVALLSAVVHWWSGIPPAPSSDKMSAQLKALRAVQRGLQWLENSRFEAPYLQSLQATMRAEQKSSVAFERYASVYGYLLLGRTQFLSILGFFLLWIPVFSLRLEVERQKLGARMPSVLDALGTFEALSSLAGYAYEQPQDVYPVYLDNDAPPALKIEGLRHPLLPRTVAVRNPVHVGVGGQDPQLLVISGSNMSGKSTYLRSIGLALVLGRLGTKVPATLMQSSNWRIGSHLRSQDSLAKGLSRFGAEVARIAGIIQASREPDPRPFLFLLDEVFSGTNSHDRRIAVDSLVRELIEQRCVGWITTHDLALTQIAKELAPRTENQHFEDQFDEKQMAFDYRLRPGVVTKSNALALMRHAGLLRE